MFIEIVKKEDDEWIFILSFQLSYKTKAKNKIVKISVKDCKDDIFTTIIVLRHTRHNQGCFRRFANSRISKTSLVWKVISFHIFAQTRLLNAPWVENLSYSQIQTSFRWF